MIATDHHLEFQWRLQIGITRWIEAWVLVGKWRSSTVNGMMISYLIGYPVNQNAYH